MKVLRNIVWWLAFEAFRLLEHLVTALHLVGKRGRIRQRVSQKLLPITMGYQRIQFEPVLVVQEMGTNVGLVVFRSTMVIKILVRSQYRAVIDIWDQEITFTEIGHYPAYPHFKFFKIWSSNLEILPMTVAHSWNLWSTHSNPSLVYSLQWVMRVICMYVALNTPSILGWA